MKFFIDFEAAQFSGYIISIGCVSECGNTFSTLVKPSNKKLTSFITELTGITDEMLVDAPTPDAAFLLLMEFVKEESCSDIPEWYCYGKEDKEFIKHTLHRMNNFYSIVFAQSIMGNLHDYSQDVKKYFENFSINPPSLLKAFLFLNEKGEGIQNHSALEDAEMLKSICEQLKEKASPEDAEALYNIKVAPKVGYSSLPKYVQRWTHESGSRKWKNCEEQEKDSTIVAVADSHVCYFKDIEMATYWINHYIKAVALKDKKNFEKTKSKIEEVLNNDKPYCGLIWRTMN